MESYDPTRTYSTW